MVRALVKERQRKMSMTTIQDGVSQSVFEILHAELVGYFQRNHPQTEQVRALIIKVETLHIRPCRVYFSPG